MAPPVRAAARRRRRLTTCALAAGRRRRLVTRLLPAALALAVLGALALAAPTQAGTFRFSQCATAAGAASPRGYQADLWWIDGGFPRVDCGIAGGRIRVAASNHRLAHYGHADAVLYVPGSMPATSMRAAWLDWTSLPRSPGSNEASFTLKASGARLIEAPAGSGTPPGHPQRVVTPAGARSLRFGTWCSPAGGTGWCRWPGHHFELRALTLELEEASEPAAAAAGPLLAGGPRRGVEPLRVSAADGDSGVRRVAVLLGGAPAGTLLPADGCRDDRLPPCPHALRGTLDVDTRRAPDGPQRLRLVVTDAAGNSVTIDAGVVHVDNQPDVTTPPPPPVPPGGAGVPVAPDGGPPGAGGDRPPFPPNPLAGRGRVPNGRNASERARVRAWLELGSAAPRRRAVTVAPGVRVRIRGRVTDPRGRPVGRAVLAAIRRERGGPWRAITGVRTRANGRFTAFTRIGPSQQVRFVYYAYGDSRRGIRSPALRVTVRRR
jgi:hypothetical protein